MSLDLEENGGLPIIISAKLSPTLGEIVMSYVGNDIFDVFNISQSLDDASTHIKLSHNEISDLGMQIVSQLEVLHKIGYTHGDLKF